MTLTIRGCRPDDWPDICRTMLELEVTAAGFPRHYPGLWEVEE